MSSGCSDSTTGGCTQTMSSNCIIYAGDNIPILGICKGDSISSVIATIIDELTASIDGTGIVLSDITPTCDFITNQLAGKNKTLFNLIQILIDSSCTLKGLIDDLQAQVDASATYDVKTITPTADTTQGVLQGVINMLSPLNTTVDNITAELGTNSIVTTMEDIAGNTLINNVSSGYGVTKTGSSSSANLSFYAFVPPFCPIFCVAPLSYFQASGAGVVGSPFEGFWICNGNNGTPDMRGYVPSGATALPGISSPSLQSEVDATVQGDLSYNTSVGDRRGANKVVLSTSEIPAHTHTFADSTHSHTVNVTTFNEGDIVPVTPKFALTDGAGIPKNTSSTTVGGNSSSVGTNSAHENRQPSYYGYFIMRKI